MISRAVVRTDVGFHLARSAVGLRPAERGQRPQRRGEPRVEHVGVLHEAGALQPAGHVVAGALADADEPLGGRVVAAARQLRQLLDAQVARGEVHHRPLRIRRPHEDVLTLAEEQVLPAHVVGELVGEPLERHRRRPHRDPVPPPELPRDAPVAEPLVPGLEGLRVARRREREPGRGGLGVAAEALVLGRLPLRRIHRPQRRALQLVVGHGQVPLVRVVRLDRRVAAVAVADRVAVRDHLRAEAFAP